MGKWLGKESRFCAKRFRENGSHSMNYFHATSTKFFLNYSWRSRTRYLPAMRVLEGCRFFEVRQLNSRNTRRAGILTLL